MRERISPARTYRVEQRRDFRPGLGMDWLLYTYGQGHWCVGNGYAGAFRTETEAHAAGAIWVATGLDRGAKAPQLAAAIEALARLCARKRHAFAVEPMKRVETRQEAA